MHLAILRPKKKKESFSIPKAIVVATFFLTTMTNSHPELPKPMKCQKIHSSTF